MSKITQIEVNGIVYDVGGPNWSTVPISSTATGTPGSMAYDSNYLYVCVSTNLWKRVALSSWGSSGGGSYSVSSNNLNTSSGDSVLGHNLILTGSDSVNDHNLILS